MKRFPLFVQQEKVVRQVCAKTKPTRNAKRPVKLRDLKSIKNVRGGAICKTPTPPPPTPIPYPNLGRP
jgi:hypothetical protein